MFWKKRRLNDESALERARMLPCVRCGKPPPNDPAHIKSKGSGGDDIDDNLLPLCRECHRYQHWIGWPRFAVTHQNVYDALLDRGWEVIRDESGIRRLVRIQEETID